MKFIELAVELSDDLVHVLGFFILVQLFDNCLLDVSFSVARDHVAGGTDDELGLNLSCQGLLSQYGFNARVLVVLEQVDVSAAHVVHCIFIHMIYWRGRAHSERRMLPVRVRELLGGEAVGPRLALEGRHVLVRVGSRLLLLA